MVRHPPTADAGHGGYRRCRARVSMGILRGERESEELGWDLESMIK